MPLIRRPRGGTNRHFIHVDPLRGSKFLLSATYSYSYNVVEIEAHLVLECHFYATPLGISSNHFLNNVLKGSLKPFFILNHQVAISLYLTKITHSSVLDNSWFDTTPLNLLVP